MEDDPYYFLQYQPYNADPEKRKALLDAHQLPPLAATPKEEDVKALAQAWKGFAGVNSYLSRDVDGRVVRLDTYVSLRSRPSCFL
jgi:aromatic amino acid aminotransferase I